MAGLSQERPMPIRLIRQARAEPHQAMRLKRVIRKYWIGGIIAVPDGEGVMGAQAADEGSSRLGRK